MIENTEPVHFKASMKTKLDKIITQFWNGEISYTEAKQKIGDAVDEAIPDVYNYKEISALAEAKRNAFNRLERKRIKLNKLKSLIK